MIFALFFAFVFPWAYFSSRSKQQASQNFDTVQTVPREDVTIVEKNSCIITVLTEEDVTVKMDIEDYVTAVVLREMPANFEIEAMKAQAVVARTYALRRHERGSKHAAAAVCTSASCCQGFYAEKEYLSDGGMEESVNKVKKAIEQTKGEVLLYNDELIEATYFSCSGGKTEDALAVWGTDFPYLQSTVSPGEEKAKYYTDSVTFSIEEFSERLGFRSSKPSYQWIEEVTYTTGGGVQTIKICGNVYKGTTIRSKLGLRSTCFLMTSIGDSVTVTTKGYGHRVGMSQYGADAMAAQGSDYTEILAHYYQGTDLKKYDGN